MTRPRSSKNVVMSDVGENHPETYRANLRPRMLQMNHLDFGFFICAVVFISMITSTATTLILLKHNPIGVSALTWNVHPVCVNDQKVGNSVPMNEKEENIIHSNNDEAEAEEETFRPTTNNIHPFEEEEHNELHPKLHILERAQLPRVYSIHESQMIEDKSAEGINLVNENRHEEAISVFSDMLNLFPDQYVGHVGRGSAYALSKKYKLALADFSKAISIQPNIAEAYKRRAQTKAKTMDFLGAIEDVTEALTKKSGGGDDPSLYLNRGAFRSMAGAYNAAISDFLKYVKHDETNAVAFLEMGNAYVALGSSEKAISCYLQAINLDENDNVKSKSWKLAADAASQLGNNSRAIEYAQNAVAIMPSNADAIIRLLTVFYDIGNYSSVIAEARALCHDNLGQDNDCKFIKGMAHQSRGELNKALDIYDNILRQSPNHRSFYQRQVALVQLAQLDQRRSEYTLDRSVSPQVKEGMTTSVLPENIDKLGLKWTRENFVDDVKVPFHGFDRKNGETSRTKALKKLNTFLTENFERSILQVNSPGFFYNIRQHRQSVFAAVEVAQALREKIVERQSAIRAFHNWRDVMDIVTHWRQIVSANDSVWWIDGMHQWNTVSDIDGFGLATTIVSGPLRVVRYYPYFKKAFALTKQLLVEQYDLTGAQAESCRRAQSLFELYRVLRRDFWVTKLINVSSNTLEFVEGTRLVLRKIPKHRRLSGASKNHQFEFLIRTPGTPRRWSAYGKLLEEEFEKLSRFWLMCRNDESCILSHKEKITNLAFRIFFWWANFAPLSRGSAATGYTLLTGILLTFSLKINSKIPPRWQADWEALLIGDPEEFVKSAKKKWARHVVFVRKNIDKLPKVSIWISTTRMMYMALNDVDRLDKKGQGGT
jgi:tetratricopeptide (TPR) repeat protein